MYRWTMYSTGCINGCMSKMEHVCLYSFVVEFDSADVSYVERVRLITLFQVFSNYQELRNKKFFFIFAYIFVLRFDARRSQKHGVENKQEG